MISLRKDFFQAIIRKIKENLSSIYHARGSAHEIALGAAVGAFWGVFPTFGLSTVLTLLIYRLIKFNLIAAISSAFISNPLTSPFLLMLSYKVGSYFVDSEVVFEYENWYRDLPNIGYALLIGSTIVSSVTAVVVYVVTKWAIEKHRIKKV